MNNESTSLKGAAQWHLPLILHYSSFKTFIVPCISYGSLQTTNFLTAEYLVM